MLRIYPIIKVVYPANICHFITLFRDAITIFLDAAGIDEGLDPEKDERGNSHIIIEWQPTRERRWNGVEHLRQWMERDA